MCVCVCVCVCVCKQINNANNKANTHRPTEPSGARKQPPSTVSHRPATQDPSYPYDQARAAARSRAVRSCWRAVPSRYSSYCCFLSTTTEVHCVFMCLFVCVLVFVVLFARACVRACAPPRTNANNGSHHASLHPNRLPPLTPLPQTPANLREKRWIIIPRSFGTFKISQKSVP